MELHLITYRWGTLYGVEYVNRLRGMVARNLSLPHTFHCMTDDPAGLRDDIVPHLLPKEHFNGNWNKVMTFQTDFLGLEGQLLVALDLDLVIVDSIDFLADDPQDDFKICGRNWVRGQQRGNSSVYRVRVGAFPEVWERLATNPEEVISTYHARNRQMGDQNYINSSVERLTFFPDEKIVSFKRHCSAKGRLLFGKLGEKLGLTTARFGVAKVPPGAAIISFHGDPLPVDVMEGRYGNWRYAPFVKEHWHD